MMGISVFLLLSVWFLATVLTQIRPAFRARWYIKRLNFLFRLPLWRLFDGSPLNYHLLYRDQLADGHMDRWKVVSFRYKKSAACLVWNPQFCPALDVWFLVRRLAMAAEKKQLAALESIAAYKIVLTYIFSLPRSNSSTGRQFRITSGAGHTQYQPHKTYLTTEFHPWSNN